MSITRRTFVKQASLATAALSLSHVSFARNHHELTGIQLYSIREDMKKDPMKTLQALSKMGYKHVEHANYVDRKFYGWKAKEFKKILGDLGMTMPSGHTVFAGNHWDAGKKDFSDTWKYLVEDAAAMGQEYVISPWMDEKIRTDKSSLLEFLEVFNKNGELCKSSGMKFGYHNHHFEFTEKVEGEVLYDIILKNTDPNLVVQQLDIGNMENGGAKALDWINKYPGRFPSLHVKDEIKSSGGHEKYESTVLGTGIVGVKSVIDEAKKSGGAHHFIIEVESYQGRTPLQSVELCLKAMDDWGYNF